MKRNPEPGTTYPLSPPVGGRLALRNVDLDGATGAARREVRSGTRPGRRARHRQGLAAIRFIEELTPA
jgi:hypothetical protein